MPSALYAVGPITLHWALKSSTWPASDLHSLCEVLSVYHAGAILSFFCAHGVMLLGAGSRAIVLAPRRTRTTLVGSREAPGTGTGTVAAHCVLGEDAVNQVTVNYVESFPHLFRFVKSNELVAIHLYII